MNISKAIEILTMTELQGPPLVPQDFLDAYKLGIEALKRQESIRIHPNAPVYGPLPGESIPERGIK